MDAGTNGAVSNAVGPPSCGAEAAQIGRTLRPRNGRRDAAIDELAGAVLEVMDPQKALAASVLADVARRYLLEQARR